MCEVKMTGIFECRAQGKRVCSSETNTPTDIQRIYMRYYRTLPAYYHNVDEM